MKIEDSVLFWTGLYAGSGFVFTKDTVVAVDAQSRKDQADLTIKLLTFHGLNPRNIKYLINTHNDFDHIGGNAEFLKRLPGIKVIAGAADSAKIENPLDGLKGRSGFRTERVIEHLIPCEVAVKIHEDTTLELGDLQLKIVHTPGHTPGSICVYHQDSKSLFTGDTVIGAGRWGGPMGVPAVRGDLNTMIASLEKLLELEVEWLLPGHGQIVHDGGERIQKSIEALKGLPKLVLGALEEEATVSELSDKLLVYPDTIEAAIRVLEEAGNVRRGEKESQLSAVTWIAK